MPRFIKKCQTILLLALPAVVFFSYHPVISLGSNDFMNFDLSLVEIWLVLYFLFSLKNIPKLIQHFGWQKLGVSALIPAYLTLSIFWSANPLRAVLTAGIFWLLVFAVLNIIFSLKSRPSLRPQLVKILLISSAIIAVFCWVQCVLNLLGVSTDFTLLCHGCTYTAFGFPHPNGFAIEPQFMGNLLLAPILLTLYLLYASAYHNHKQKISLIILLLFLATTIFLTLSRGAIYSLVVGVVALFIVSCTKQFPIIKHKLKIASFTALSLVVSFAISLVAEGIFAAVSPTTDTFVSGVTKSIHQLSLGVIDLRPAEIKNQPDSQFQASNSQESPTTADQEPQTLQESTAQATQSDSTFSGYVAESTDVRLGLNSLALDTWRSSPRYIVIGAGLGSAGIAMHSLHPAELGPKEIVQNEYFSLLLELGLVGYAVIILVAIYAIKFSQKSPLSLALLLSFAFSLLFFSGLPNALHIYLLPAIFATKDNFLIKDKVQHHRHQRH